MRRMPSSYRQVFAMVEARRCEQQDALPANVILTRAGDVKPGDLVLDATLRPLFTVSRSDDARAKFYVVISGTAPNGDPYQTSRHILDDLFVRPWPTVGARVRVTSMARTDAIGQVRASDASFSRPYLVRLPNWQADGAYLDIQCTRDEIEVVR